MRNDQSDVQFVQDRLNEHLKNKNTGGNENGRKSGRSITFSIVDTKRL